VLLVDVDHTLDRLLHSLSPLLSARRASRDPEQLKLRAAWFFSSFFFVSIRMHELDNSPRPALPSTFLVVGFAPTAAPTLPSASRSRRFADLPAGGTLSASVTASGGNPPPPPLTRKVIEQELGGSIGCRADRTFHTTGIE